MVVAMLRRLQRLHNQRNASEDFLQRFHNQRNASEGLRQHPIVLSSSPQGIDTGSFRPVLMASEAEALQSLDSDPEAEGILRSGRDADSARMPAANEAQGSFQNLDYRTQPAPGARQTSITEGFGPGRFRPLRRRMIPENVPDSNSESQEFQTSEFRNGMFRPLQSDEPWIPVDCPDSNSESQELPENLDDELLLPLEGDFEWEVEWEHAPTSRPSPSERSMCESQSSKASSILSAHSE
eukprot:TRINITY_DN2927_c0_g4_i1.p1 TRINITY_DN2927_c0_g4~~TRINITY_DN2927_c0_g4_i1.p1  ORF type:complete len:239 (+),score=43.50 TRINITY_DN2927_c0_g4_i1:45-761(+)